MVILGFNYDTDMDPKNIRSQPILFFSIGLLLISLPIAINEVIKIPDFLRGFCVGLGLVLEIAGFVKLRRAQHEATKNPNAG